MSFLCETAASLARGICLHHYGDQNLRLSVFVSSSPHCYGDRPQGRSYFGVRWSHNRDGHMERRDACTVSPHIQPVSHFIPSFSQSVSHFIASLSRSVSQSVSRSVNSSVFKDKISFSQQLYATGSDAAALSFKLMDFSKLQRSSNGEKRKPCLLFSSLSKLVFHNLLSSVLHVCTFYCYSGEHSTDVFLLTTCVLFTPGLIGGIPNWQLSFSFDWMPLYMCLQGAIGSKVMLSQWQLLFLFIWDPKEANMSRVIPNNCISKVQESAIIKVKYKWYKCISLQIMF